MLVNDRPVVTLGAKIKPGHDAVSVNGRSVLPEKRHLYLFHKPRGVVTTMKDTHGRPSIAQYAKDLPVRVFPVGRLDADVSGLLLLTNDGEFAERMLHPRYQERRRYWALISGVVSQSELQELQQGIELDDGFAPVIAARLLERRTGARLFGRMPPGVSAVEIEVAEGRKHFVKRLLRAANLPLEQLVRVAFGEFTLGRLAPGEIRELKGHSRG